MKKPSSGRKGQGKIVILNHWEKLDNGDFRLICSMDIDQAGKNWCNWIDKLKESKYDQDKSFGYITCIDNKTLEKAYDSSMKVRTNA